jgi:imidazolonepropionase-like amidohydrolase
VAAAHRRGKPVAAHCRGVPGIRNAVDAGVDHIEHACFERADGTLKFDPVLAEEMAAAGMAVTPTIQLYRDARAHLEQKRIAGELTPVESDYLGRLPAVIAEKYRALRGFVDLGVKCVAGNDAGLPHTGFGRFWQELDAMVDGGLTPFQALAAATCIPAQVTGLDDEIGSIRAGRRADLIWVEDDPTRDITALGRIALVMLGGQIVKGP